MARYRYHCTVCKSEFEVEKPMARAAAAESCPACGRTGERVYTAPGLSRKGSEVAFGCGGACESEPGHVCAGCCHGGECGAE